MKDILHAGALIFWAMVWTVIFLLVCIPGVILMFLADVFGGPFQKLLDKCGHWIFRVSP